MRRTMLTILLLSLFATFKTETIEAFTNDPIITIEFDRLIWLSNTVGALYIKAIEDIDSFYENEFSYTAEEGPDLFIHLPGKKAFVVYLPSERMNTVTDGIKTINSGLRFKVDNFTVEAKDGDRVYIIDRTFNEIKIRDAKHNTLKPETIIIKDKVAMDLLDANLKVKNINNKDLSYRILLDGIEIIITE